MEKFELQEILRKLRDGGILSSRGGAQLNDVECEIISNYIIVLENERNIAYEQAAEKDAKYDEVKHTLREVCDLAIWMSGSPSFSREGEAYEGWQQNKYKLDNALVLCIESGHSERAN